MSPDYVRVSGQAGLCSKSQTGETTSLKNGAPSDLCKAEIVNISSSSLALLFFKNIPYHPSNPILEVLYNLGPHTARLFLFS